MTQVGIEAMNVFGGTAYLNLQRLARHRSLDPVRFSNLLMKEKAVALPCEDPITFGVNAAKPVVDALSEQDRNQIEMLITCTESGVDFGKSISTYLHGYLGLKKSCRLFEIKQACYSGTAGLQMAINFVLAGVAPGAKVLVVCTDISRYMVAEAGEILSADWSFAEPSGGAGAVAMLVSDVPNVLRVDVGANGYYGYEVMDTCRPMADGEAGDSDLSLLSYLDCCENAFREYRAKVDDVDYRKSFHYLAFHTPFGGMVKGAHRTMMRKIVKASPGEIEEDFTKRVWPGITYCQRVGNIMGGTVFMSIASTIDHGDFASPKRIGCFSYGSGCCSEFYSGVVSSAGQRAQERLAIGRHLDSRYELSMEEYEAVLRQSVAVRFGTRNIRLDGELARARKMIAGKRQALYLTGIKEFHREYEWLA